MADIFKFEGGTELKQALGLLIEATGKTTQAKAAIRRTLTEAGKITAEVAEANAPRLTGRLAASFKVGTQLTRRQRRFARTDKSNVEVYVGSSDPAAVPQEFGTFKEPAQPTLGPAWDATQDKVLDKIATESWNQIEKTARRIGKKAAR